MKIKILSFVATISLISGVANALNTFDTYPGVTYCASSDEKAVIMIDPIHEQVRIDGQSKPIAIQNLDSSLRRNGKGILMYKENLTLANGQQVDVDVLASGSYSNKFSSYVAELEKIIRENAKYWNYQRPGVIARATGWSDDIRLAGREATVRYQQDGRLVTEKNCIFINIY